MTLSATATALSLLGEEIGVKIAKPSNSLDQLDYLRRQLLTLVKDEADLTGLRAAYEAFATSAEELVSLRFSFASGKRRPATAVLRPPCISPMKWADERAVERILALPAVKEEELQYELVDEVGRLRKGDKRKVAGLPASSELTVFEYPQWEKLLRAASKAFLQAAENLEKQLRSSSASSYSATVVKNAVSALKQQVFIAMLTRLKTRIDTPPKNSTAFKPLFSLQPFAISEEPTKYESSLTVKVQPSSLPSARFSERMENLLKWELGPQFGCDINNLCEEGKQGRETPVSALRVADGLLDDLCCLLHAKWKAVMTKVQLVCKAYEAGMNTLTDSLSCKQTALREATASFYDAFISTNAPQLESAASLTNDAAVSIQIAALQAHAITMLSRDVARLRAAAAKRDSGMRSTDAVSEKTIESLFYGDRCAANGSASAAADALTERFNQFQHRYSTSSAAARFRKVNSGKAIERLLDTQKSNAANSLTAIPVPTRAPPSTVPPTQPVKQHLSSESTAAIPKSTHSLNAMRAAVTSHAAPADNQHAATANKKEEERERMTPHTPPRRPPSPYATLGPRQAPKPPAAAAAVLKPTPASPPGTPVSAASNHSPKTAPWNVERKPLTPSSATHAPTSQHHSEGVPQSPLSSKMDSQASLPAASAHRNPTGARAVHSPSEEPKEHQPTQQGQPRSSSEAASAAASPNSVSGDATCAAPPASESLFSSRYPFLARQPLPGIFLEDLDAEKDARFRAAVNRLVMKRNNYNPSNIGRRLGKSGSQHEMAKDIASQELAVNEVVKELAENLKEATFQAKLRFPFLSFRVNGVLLGRLCPLLDQDDLFQSLLHVRSQVVRGASGTADGNKHRLAGVERCLWDETKRIAQGECADKGLIHEDQIANSIAVLEEAFRSNEGVRDAMTERGAQAANGVGSTPAFSPPQPEAVKPNPAVQAEIHTGRRPPLSNQRPEKAATSRRTEETETHTPSPAVTKEEIYGAFPYKPRPKATENAEETRGIAAASQQDQLPRRIRMSTNPSEASTLLPLPNAVEGTEGASKGAKSVFLQPLEPSEKPPSAPSTATANTNFGLSPDPFDPTTRPTSAQLQRDLFQPHSRKNSPSGRPPSRSPPPPQQQAPLPLGPASALTGSPATAAGSSSDYWRGIAAGIGANSVRGDKSKKENCLPSLSPPTSALQQQLPENARQGPRGSLRPSQYQSSHLHASGNHSASAPSLPPTPPADTLFSGRRTSFRTSATPRPSVTAQSSSSSPRLPMASAAMYKASSLPTSASTYYNKNAKAAAPRTSVAAPSGTRSKSRAAALLEEQQQLETSTGLTSRQSYLRSSMLARTTQSPTTPFASPESGQFDGSLTASDVAVTTADANPGNTAATTRGRVTSFSSAPNQRPLLSTAAVTSGKTAVASPPPATGAASLAFAQTMPTRASIGSMLVGVSTSTTTTPKAAAEANTATARKRESLFAAQRRLTGMGFAAAASTTQPVTSLRSRPNLIFSPTDSLNDVYLTACKALGMRPNSALIRAFPCLRSARLEKIDLSVNYVGAKGLLPVLYALEHNGDNLRALSLSNNNLENMEALDVLEVLSGPAGSNLTHLDLSYNPISQTGGQALLRFATARPNLVSIAIKGTLIPPKLMQTIIDKVEDNNFCRHIGLA